MSEEPNLYEFLKADAAVYSFVGDRIYPDRIEQQNPDDRQVMPCAVFQLAGAEYQAKFCETDELVGGAYQMDIYGPDRDQVIAAARAIRQRLSDYRGQMGAGRVSKVLLQNQFNGLDPDPGLYRRTQLYTIWYLED